MAGSYGHVNPVDGSWDLIDDMGDAQELTEQLLWLVLRMTPGDTIAVKDGYIRALLDSEFHPMQRGERSPDLAFEAVEKVMEEREL